MLCKYGKIIPIHVSDIIFYGRGKKSCKRINIIHIKICSFYLEWYFDLLFEKLDLNLTFKNQNTTRNQHETNKKSIDILKDWIFQSKAQVVTIRNETKLFFFFCLSCYKFISFENDSLLLRCFAFLCFYSALIF